MLRSARQGVAAEGVLSTEIAIACGARNTPAGSAIDEDPQGRV
jgi:hypothetical protein